MNFRYKAYLADAREKAGEIEAADKQDAMRQLNRQGFTVFELEGAKPSKETVKNIRKSPRTFVLTTRRFIAAQLFSDLALLTGAGLTITQALRSMHSTENNIEQRNIIGQLLDNMSSGASATTAFGAIKSMPAENIGLIASGESAGKLHDVFQALSAQYEERAKIKSQLQNALGYPVFLFVLMIVAILVLTFVLVPAIEPIFQNADMPAPFVVSMLSILKRALTGDFLSVGPFILILVLPLTVMPASRQKMRNYASSILLRLPFIKTISKKVALARYLSSLSLLILNGTTMSKALALAAASVSNPAMRTKLDAARDRVITGERLPSALEYSGLFDERLISLLAVGDEANRLPIVAKRASQILDSEAQTAINRLIAVLTPAMTITLGLLVGGLVVSVMTALLSINEIAIQ
jgi:general secretion pathway protein F